MPEHSQLQQACSVLEHYHIEHTHDIVTRFKASGTGADIYVVQDPEWKDRLQKCVEEIFPEGHAVTKLGQPNETTH